ncbi:DapH/DapD/GlmU-related protein [Methanococcus maripaludis]|jgi:carbon dioxide concentrating mechanism protein CcmM|uniref:Carbonate dehydratase n=3 Tax=Methanococcus maripaludis TaxID=39152 RepID=A0A8T3W646_METMI|nr:DapH/DapD/GlmU-related protein [Methanococcus maripaludis]MBG0768663.1 carbonate dehydratase [Methanococcus maripaludis]MDI6724059.1 DapH/DapD/GlmU-related protein [Methanobacterium sp.]BAP61351.1 carbonic anhydrase [Methanococcus maripaludis KA1]BAP63250.1 carbonic anhydrase [Methanococcus maripaludis OS7]
MKKEYLILIAVFVAVIALFTSVYGLSRSPNVSASPITSWSSQMQYPQIDATSFVDPSARVIGDVTIGSNVYIGPSASVRGDEGSPIFIGDGSNIQDGVVVHGLKDPRVVVGDKNYSVYVGREVSMAHGSVIHGPVFIGDKSFIGFGAVIFKANIGKNCVILHNAVVTDNVNIPDGKLVPAGAVIDTQAKADALTEVTEDLKELPHEVVTVNKELAKTYKS